MVKKMGRESLQKSFIICILVMLLTSFIVYYFSDDSHVKVLSCKGNYYLTSDQIYDLAKVDTNTRMFLTPSFLVENRIEKNPFIDSCTVSKSDKKLSIKVKEKMIIGYYVSDSKNYALCIDGSSFTISKKYLKTIVHFPLISEFTKKQRAQLCRQFNKNKKNISCDLIEKIAEIVPYKSTYDTNMFKITMQDGNIVYSDLSSLDMLSKYQSVLTALKGQSVCLVLDSQHSAIEKVSCDSMVQKSDEEIAEANKKTKKKTSNETTNEETTTQESTEDTSNSESTDETTSEESTDENTQQEDTSSEYVYDENTGLYYNASIGMYYDPNSGYYFDDNYTYYTWDEESQTFVIVEQ